jgi:predicted transcriptional regulator
MVKRNKLEILKDIMAIVRDNHNSIKPTPLLRKSNISSKRFKEYLNELYDKKFICDVVSKKGEKLISLSEKGFRYLEKYKTIVNFIEEFEL